MKRLDPVASKYAANNLRALLEFVAPDALAAYDEWVDLPAATRYSTQPAIAGWEATHRITDKDMWEQVYTDADRARHLDFAKRELNRHAHEEGATLTGYSDLEYEPGVWVGTRTVLIRAHGWLRVRPKVPTGS